MIIDIQQQLINYYTQLLKYRNEVEKFRIDEFKTEFNNTPLLMDKILEQSLYTQFGMIQVNVERLMLTLVEDPEIFDIFCDNSEEFLQQDPDNYDLVVNRLLLDLTEATPDNKLVYLSNKIISKQVEKANSLQDLKDSEVLRCLFEAKINVIISIKIDTQYLNFIYLKKLGGERGSIFHFLLQPL